MVKRGETMKRNSLVLRRLSETMVKVADEIKEMGKVDRKRANEELLNALMVGSIIEKVVELERSKRKNKKEK